VTESEGPAAKRLERETAEARDLVDARTGVGTNLGNVHGGFRPAASPAEVSAAKALVAVRRRTGRLIPADVLQLAEQG